MDIEIFEKQAAFVRALASHTRLQIIHLLRNHALTVSQIVSMLGASQSVTSQHLKALKIAQIVSFRKEGKEVYYTISDQRIIVACDAIRSLASGDKLPDSPEPVVVDPVCGMDLTPSTASFTDTYNGIRHYFCAKGCYQKFANNKAHYVR